MCEGAGLTGMKTKMAVWAICAPQQPNYIFTEPSDIINSLANLFGLM